MVAVLVLVLVAGCADPKASRQEDEPEDATEAAPEDVAQEQRVSQTAPEAPVLASNNTTGAFDVALPTWMAFPATGGEDLRRVRVNFPADWSWNAMTATSFGSERLGFILLPVGKDPQVTTACGKETPPQYLFRQVGGNLFPFDGTAGAYDIWYWNVDSTDVRIEFKDADGNAAPADAVAQPPAEATGWEARSWTGSYATAPTAPTGGLVTGTLTTAGPSWVLVTAANPTLSEGSARAAVEGTTVCSELTVSATAQTGGVAVTSAGVGAGTWTWSASYDGTRPSGLPRLDDRLVAMVVVGPKGIDSSALAA
jgi:hypothetical protein